MEILGLKEKYLQDLTYFLEYVDTKRGMDNDPDYPLESFHLNFYLNHTKEELYTYINQFLINNEVNDDYEFYYFLKYIIKYMSGTSDSHTMIYKSDNIWFPIKFKVINNNVFIDKCFDKKYIKKQVKNINNIGIEQIVNEIETCTNYGTKGWLLYNIENTLASKNNLLCLPSLHNNNNNIVFETEDNEKISFDVNKNYNKQVIYPKEDNEQYKIYEDTILFKYPSCSNEFKPDIDKIESMIIANNICRFILDLRGNSGGNSNIILPLIEYLSTKDLELYTIVDKGVFSSGRFAAIDMKRIGSKIVGEEIGTPINCFGYVSGNGLTPNTKINFHLARVYWYEEKGFMKGLYTKEELSKQNKEFFEPKYLQLDIQIEISEEEYKNSSDDIFLNKCLETIKNNKINKV